MGAYALKVLTALQQWVLQKEAGSDLDYVHTGLALLPSPGPSKRATAALSLLVIAFLSTAYLHFSATQGPHLASTLKPTPRPRPT